MSPKFTAVTVAITFALGLTHAMAADEAANKENRRPADARPSEDILARTVFQTLLGEIALQRGDGRLGTDAWYDLALRTRDPQALARATEVAGFTRQYDKALELTKIWLEVEPGSAQARQAQSTLFVLTNRVEELAPQLAKLLEEDKANLPSNLLQLNRMLARLTDKAATQKLVNLVAAPYENLPEAHFAMGQAAANAGDNERALREIERCLKLRPTWEAAALIRAQLQAGQSTQLAIATLSEFVEHNPQAQDARMGLARALMSEKRYTEARVHFEKLIQSNPDNIEITYLLGMLALQHGDTATGRSQLEKLLKTDFPNKSAVHFFLGQLDQEQNNPDSALSHYREVNTGEQYIPARSRAALILWQQGKPDEARELLRTTRTGNEAEKTQLTLAESQMLRDQGRPNDAYIVLEKALSAQPDSHDLLYEAALSAERLGKPEILEVHLKHLLKLKPDHAHALNALGYSLADRKLRLPEAQTLIAKALSLMPEDPFILDSMGWVLYRRGQLSEAFKTLERAYSIKADPEIAAHLSEVMARLGMRSEAKNLLEAAAANNPGNKLIENALKALHP